MDLDLALKPLFDKINDMDFKIGDADRRAANILRPGRVTEVDGEKGLMKLTYAKDDEGQDVITNWVPYATRASSKGIRDWDMPVVGEQVNMYSPSGDIGPNSWVMAGGFSAANPPNHNVPGERKIQIKDKTWLLLKDGETTLYVDKATITVKADSITSTIGGTTFTMKDGSIEAKTTTFKIDAETFHVTGDVQFDKNLNVTKDMNNQGNMVTDGIHKDSNGFHS